MAAANVTPLLLGGAAALSIGLYLGGNKAQAAPKHGAALHEAELGMARERANMRRSMSHDQQTIRSRPSGREPSSYGHLAKGHHDSLDQTIREVHFWFT